MGLCVRSMKERIILLKRILLPDQMGGLTEQWEKNKTVWGMVIPLYSHGFSRESNKGIRIGGKEMQGAGFRIILHALSGNTIFQRIDWRGRTLALTTRPELEQNGRFLVCYASELKESEGGKFNDTSNDFEDDHSIFDQQSPNP